MCAGAAFTVSCAGAIGWAGVWARWQWALRKKLLGGLGEGHHLTPDALATSKVSAASVLDLSCNECGRRPVVWACE